MGPVGVGTTGEDLALLDSIPGGSIAFRSVAHVVHAGTEEPESELEQGTREEFRALAKETSREWYRRNKIKWCLIVNGAIISYVTFSIAWYWAVGMPCCSLILNR